MKTYIIGDNHYYHANIIRYCNRHPADRISCFYDVYEMNEYMVAAWNQTVGKDDEVIHVGDYALCRYFDQLMSVFKRLNGHTTLILGNHDCHSNLTKERLYRVGFSRIEPKEIVLPDQKIIITHKPVPNLNPDWFNIHGHIHDKPAETPNAFNVSVERNDYHPFLLQDVIDNHVIPYFNKRKDSPNA